MRMPSAAGAFPWIIPKLQVKTMRQLDNCLEVAIRAAKAAGRMQKERLLTEYVIDYKGETNLVTDVDRECEKIIVETVREEFPGCDILAEENSYSSHDSLFRWIIDPLDGTTNYAHGFPWFCVSLALEIAGTLMVGVIYHPMMDELFSAINGEGAWLDGKRLHVSRNQPLRKSLLATGFPYDKTLDNENNFENFVNFQLAARGVRRAGSAALDLAYVAAGRLDGFWECKLNPWDVAAGTLLVREAGGKVTDFSGRPYSLGNHRIVATNGHVHDEMLAILGFKDISREPG
ncbi:MAG: hisN [Geobacteraceae bacterium]|nr:hisN [Geobacteraceae bacterium]